MDYIAGGELFTYLRTEGKLEPDHAMMYSAQVALMFEYLHAKNIIYRDLKPENILIDNECRVKICDFGLSRGTVENDTNNFESNSTAATLNLSEKNKPDKKLWRRRTSIRV